MPDKHDLDAETFDAIRDMLARWYEAGRAAGAAEVRAQIAAVLSPGAPGSTILTAPLEHRFGSAAAVEAGDTLSAHGRGVDSHPEGRAAPGSVKPVILAVVTEQPGLTTDAIQKRTGIKQNSVRGTLWTLSKENLVERRGSGWFPLSQKNEAADESPTKEPSAASVTGAEGASDPPRA